MSLATELVSVLRGNQIVSDAFNQIELAPESKPIDVSLDTDVPAVFVFTGERSAEDEEGDGHKFTQGVNRVIRLMIICKVGEIDDRWMEVHKAISGYQADNFHDPLYFQKGAQDKLSGDYLSWIDVYSTRQYIS